MLCVELPRGQHTPPPSPPKPAVNRATPAADATYWLVWRVGAAAPTYRHSSFDSADTEARRLARAHCGDEFVVLETVRSHRASDLVTTDLRPDRGLPF